LELNSLLRLADQGIQSLLPDDLRRLADWCWDYGEATGDARYCSLWKALDRVVEAFTDQGHVTNEKLEHLNLVLARDLPGIVSEKDPASASMQARSMREALFGPTL
jgi:hypothetical protein